MITKLFIITLMKIKHNTYDNKAFYYKTLMITKLFIITLMKIKHNTYENKA